MCRSEHPNLSEVNSSEASRHTLEEGMELDLTGFQAAQRADGVFDKAFA